MERTLTRFNHRLRFPPIRHKKSKQYALNAVDAVADPLPSYEDCAVFFYPPPSYTESVRESAIRPKQRHSMGSHSSSVSAASSAPPSASSVQSTSSSSFETQFPSAPPMSPVPTSFTACSTPSQRLSSASTSSPRSVLSHSSSTIINSSTSSSDVISRIQPRVRSWTQCIRWVIQYTLESNFKSTVAHFQCLVTEGLRISEHYEEDSEIYPIRLDCLSVQRPTALSLKIWAEFILCMGFKFSECPRIINNNNNNVNNNNNNNILYHNSRNNSVDDVNSDPDIENVEQPPNFLVSFFENANNNNGNVDDSMEGICLIVPRGLAPQKLKKYRYVFAGLLELPYCGIKTAANMSLTESERVISLLTAIKCSVGNTSTDDQSSLIGQDLTLDHTLPVDHALVRSIWDFHRRPGFFLKSLDFTMVRPTEGGKRLKIPTGDVARRQLFLAKEILEMFVRN